MQQFLKYCWYSIIHEKKWHSDFLFEQLVQPHAAQFTILKENKITNHSDLYQNIMAGTSSREITSHGWRHGPWLPKRELEYAYGFENDIGGLVFSFIW